MMLFHIFTIFFLLGIGNSTQHNETLNYSYTGDFSFTRLEFYVEYFFVIENHCNICNSDTVVIVKLTITIVSFSLLYQRIKQNEFNILL